MRARKAPVGGVGWSGAVTADALQIASASSEAVSESRICAHAKRARPIAENLSYSEGHPGAIGTARIPNHAPQLAGG
jgi:hypothetical protein